MPSTYHLFATAPRGLEGLLADELRGIGAADAHERRGGVAFTGDLALAYRVCLWSRVANRVLLPLAEFSASDADGLYAGVREIDWPEHLGPDATIAVDFTGVRAAVTHSRYGVQRVKDAVVDVMRERTGARPSVDADAPDLRINTHMAGQAVTIALDLSGDSLHRRGYREPGVAASLKENLAAAVLLRGGWPEVFAAGGGFVDPMCGSGTLAIEAAWMAADVAPGLLRTRFGFPGWKGHDDTAWKWLLDEALERQEAGVRGLPPVVAYDQDPLAIRQALVAVQRAGLGGQVHVERRELADARPPSRVATGLLAVNPPYGERLSLERELVPLYARLGQTLREQFQGWRAIVITGADAELGLRPDRRWLVFNGPISCRLERFEIARQDPQRAPPPPAAESLINRLRKNRRQLNAWLKRSGVSSYRIYDADIPEYALAIDVYGTAQGDWLHVQEYEPPANARVDPKDARARLRAALSALPVALDVAPERTVLKVRRRQRGEAQYTRQAAEGGVLEVREGACRLLVNLTDYLDTGLFLDHRPVRLWLGEAAAGKRVLNLFCYTGAATVHAAVGGAAATTSVDLSRTYLDWLRRNLQVNGLNDFRHQVVQADCRDWLAACRGHYDLIFLDPPSFSNSKRMEGTLDVQRDHADLIQMAAACLAPGGVLIFSTNLRRFKLDEPNLDGLTLEDRTPWSIPEDFERNRRIHQCYFIRRH